MRTLLKKAVARLFTDARAARRRIYASHAAFYVIVSSIPMLLLVMQVFSRVSPGGARMLAQRLLSALPGELSGILPEELFPGEASAPLISVTALTLTWSASKGLLAVSQGICAVCGGQPERSPVRRHLTALMLTVAFLFVTVFSLAVLVLGPGVCADLARSGSRWSDVLTPLTKLGWLLSLGLFTAVFALLYKFSSGLPLRLVLCLPGAAAAGAGWLAASALLSLYLRLFDGGLSPLYGGFGALLLLMVWVRVCMSILLLGAEFNLWLPAHPVFIRLRRKKR